MSDAALPAGVQTLSDRLPLPSAELITALAASELLEAYLQRQLLEALCDEQLGPAAPLGDPAAALLAFGQRHGLTTLEQVEAWRHGCRLSLDQLERLVVFEPRLRQASEQLWSSEVASSFLQRRADFDRVVLSVVRFEDPDLATELFFQLQEGSLSFADLVEHHAQGLDRANRGLVGPIRVQQLNPLLARVVRRYRPGVFIPPLDINGCVHLMRIESLQPAQLDDPLREQLLLSLRSQWLRQQLARLRQRLLEDAPLVAELVNP